MTHKHLDLGFLLVLAACSSAQVVKTPTNPDVALTPAEVQTLEANGVNPEALTCNSRRMWNPTLRAEAKAGAQAILSDLTQAGVPIPTEKAEVARHIVTDALMWRMVRATLVDGNQNNLGVVQVKDVKTQDGRPLLVFRSGFTPAPGQEHACVQSLVQAGVKHGVNLYQGPMPTLDLEQAEAAAYQKAGGTYFTVRTDPQLASWRDELREDPAAEKLAMQSVAKVIREGILQPGGKDPAGYVAVHCGGGMHRTGMVMGVLERCWNGAPEEVWAATYKRHVAWKSDAEPGGFEPANLQFIAHFDCSLLQKNR